ncbi:MAG: ABC transporter ATP-binding protein [Clostridiales bacterium]|nr:ABC transporter ATP-binding protein [Clostridiales bacterium]
MPKQEKSVGRGMGHGPHLHQKPKNFKKSLKKLFSYLKTFLPVIIIALVLAVGASVLSVIGPKKLSAITGLIEDGLLFGIDTDAVTKVAISLLIIFGVSAIFSFFQQFIMATVANKFAKKLRTNISKKINSIPLGYLDTHSRGDVLSRVTNDVDTVGHSLSQSIGTLISAVTLLFGSLIMMFVTNWIMALTAIASSVIGFALMMLIMAKSQKYFRQRQAELGKVNGHIEEIYSAHNLVKAYNAQEKTSSEFNQLNKQLYKSNKKSEFLSGLMPPLMGFIGNFGYVAICVVGAVLVVNGYIGFEIIIEFMLYVRLFTSPLSQIAQGFNHLQSGVAASERVFEFLEEKNMSSEESCIEYINPTNAKGDIEFVNVHFGYLPEKTIIQDFSCKVKAGQKIAIVGPTGAGKTTLVNLLMKFYDINDGDIVIDGKSIKTLKRSNVHNLFTMVLQDTWLFEGSVRDNICFNRKDISDEQILEVCKVVGIDKFVLSLPHGLNTILDDNNSISAGQKQLLTIARGMISNAPFLILDEATSSVDTRTEELVQKAMDKLTENRTSFIIAHRLSTIKNADKILVLDNGNIVEQGNHKKLLELNGFYANLYNSQFKK